MSNITAHRWLRGRRGFSLPEVLTSLIIIGILISVVYSVFILNWQAFEDYSTRAGMWQDMDQIIDQVTIDAREAATVTVSADQKNVSMFDKKGNLLVSYSFLSNKECHVIRGSENLTLTHNLDYTLSLFEKKSKSLSLNVVLRDDVFGRGVSIDASTEIFPRN
ncbi:MAG: prepilin-type N-terminal cleavage/methylation domain-containing protein [Candidatus Omnitrophica bacterium]|nr:prepilin-type N-terminal cleavage/methylation domain-containing protein [Candidatus Omnitrophota bacterium]